MASEDRWWNATGPAGISQDIFDGRRGSGCGVATPRGSDCPGRTRPGGGARARASRVSLAGGNDRADIAFKSLEPFKDEIAAAIGNKRVILKPNNVIINVPLCATHADNLEGILEFLSRSARPT